MAKRIILLGLVCGLLGGAAGCGLLCCPPGPGMMCGPGYCAPPVCDSTCGVDCGVPCEPACAPPCEPSCGPAGYGSHCGPVGPLACLFRLFRPASWCGPVCGEAYCGDPPDCSDPCDRCGNFIGPSAGGCQSGCQSGCQGGYAASGHASGTAYPTVVRPAPRIAEPRRAVGP